MDETEIPGSRATVDLLRSTQPGERIGPYRILQQIGEGGFGAVFEAEQERPLKRRVALKLILTGMDTREVVARFEAERQALALMDHPHIARVLDAGATADGRPYFVMELVKGEPISRYCDRHRLSVKQRLEVFEQICQAVQHAHTKGVIHRDLKPGNVLVSSIEDKAFAKVIDFGIAKAVSGSLTDNTVFTRHRQMIGTPLYMSPEQAEGSVDIDTRTDIYSLGVMLYELLTGTTPFEASSLRAAAEAEMHRIIREVDPPRPSVRLSSSADTLNGVADRCRTDARDLTRQVRGDLDWIVMKALEKERARRYETANALALDVQRYLTGQAVLAAPPSMRYRLGKLVRRNRGAVLAASLLTLSLVGGLLSFAWQARIAEQRAAELEQLSNFQAEMLAQIDPTAAGERLSADVAERLSAALVKAGVPENERIAELATHARLWSQVNATDTALELIDTTILRPAVQAIDTQFKEQPIVDAALRQVLADRYREIGLYAAALPLQQRALDTRRALLGSEHVDTLYSINALGNVLADLGKFDEADPYWREALQTRQRVLGENHRDTLMSLSNIGYLLASQKRFAEAEPYMVETLAKRRRWLGENDRSTLVALNNMGNLLQAQGKLEQAEPYYREALEKQRHTLGEDDPSTLVSIGNLGVLLRAQGRLNEAEPYYREVLGRSRRVFGEEHAETLRALNNMGFLLRSQNRLAEAEPYYREALEKRRRVLGPDHPATLSSLDNIAALLRAQGNLSAAEQFYREVLDKRRRLLGETDPATLISINNIGMLLRMTGRYQGAIDVLMPALEPTRRVQVDAHVYRLAAMLMNLGSARISTRDFALAERDLLEAHAIYAKTPGPVPEDTQKCIRAIVALYEGWQGVDPDAGHGEQAAKWKRLLPAPGSTARQNGG